MLRFFRDLDSHRAAVLVAAETHGCDLSNTTARNKAFFALEFLEQRYIRQVLIELSRDNVLTSMILVHDGIYFAPATRPEVVLDAAERASKSLSLPTFELKYRDLSNEWRREFGHISRSCALLPNPAKRRRSNQVAAETSVRDIPQSVISFCPAKRKLCKQPAHLGRSPASTPPKRTKPMCYQSNDKQVRLHVGTCTTTLDTFFVKKRIFDLDG